MLVSKAPRPPLKFFSGIFCLNVDLFSSINQWISVIVCCVFAFRRGLWDLGVGGNGWEL